MTAVCVFAVVRLIHPAPPPLNTIGPPSLTITRVLTKTSQPVILAGEAGKNRRERFFASEASPKGAYQG